MVEPLSPVDAYGDGSYDGDDGFGAMSFDHDGDDM